MSANLEKKLPRASMGSVLVLMILQIGSQQVAEASPHVFQERMEAVTRLFAQYEQSKAKPNES